MDNLNKFKAAVLLFLFLVSVGNGDVDDEASKIPTNIIDAAKSLHSLPTASESWFHPPNIDFRAGGGGGDEEASGKLKDAVVKSLDKSKAAVQDSAKSLADNLKHKLYHQSDL